MLYVFKYVLKEFFWIIIEILVVYFIIELIIEKKFLVFRIFVCVNFKYVNKIMLILIDFDLRVLIFGIFLLWFNFYLVILCILFFLGRKMCEIG